MDSRNWAVYQLASRLVARRITRGSKESGLSQNSFTTTTTVRFLIVVMSHGSCCCLAKSLASPGSATKHTSEINRGRSDEHTSDLQSLMRTSYADFCLKQQTHLNTYTTQLN